MVAMALLAAALAATASGGQEPSTVRVFPLPMYTTVPNEGSTYGIMPVIVNLAGAAGIQHIFAPSVSWNQAVHVTGTFRYYRFIDALRSYSVIVGASTRTNRTLILQYTDVTLEPGHVTVELNGLARRSLFYRYFGLGPDTRASDETSYVRTLATATARVGYNLPWHLNLGLRAELRGDDVGRTDVFDLPALQDRFPTAPGIDGAALATGGLALRYDTRVGGDYAERGVASELHASVGHGLRGLGAIGQFGWHTRALWRETGWLQGAARLHLAYAAGRDLPFYYQSSLGGELLFRGFTEDRFFDRGAWEVELEQRVRLLRTRLFGVTTDWRLDPFVAAGQVWPHPTEMFGHVRLSAGVGLRAWVSPNVLGRVDVAWAGEGVKAYVVLGYPY